MRMPTSVAERTALPACCADRAPTGQGGAAESLPPRAAGLGPVPSGEPTRARELTPLPDTCPQQTFLEVRSLCTALADVRLRHWGRIDGEDALVHRSPGQSLEIKLAPGRPLLGLSPAWPSDDQLAALQRLGVPAVLLAHLAVKLALGHVQVTVPLDDQRAATLPA